MANSAWGGSQNFPTGTLVTATGDGSTTTFALGVAPHGQVAVDVYLSGIRQHTSEWSLSAQNLVFSEAPPASVPIMVIVKSGQTVGSLSDGVVTNAKLAAGALFTAGTEQASTSGTAIDFTGIPAGVQIIVVMFDGVSTNGTLELIVQVGDSGGPETGTYAAASSIVNTSSAANTLAETTGFNLFGGDAARVWSGAMVLTLEDPTNHVWVAHGNFASADSLVSCAGKHDGLDSALTQVRITTVGSNSFDAGAVSIMYR